MHSLVDIIEEDIDLSLLIFFLARCILVIWVLCILLQSFIFRLVDSDNRVFWLFVVLEVLELRSNIIDNPEGRLDVHVGGNEFVHFLRSLLYCVCVFSEEVYLFAYNLTLRVHKLKVDISIVYFENIQEFEVFPGNKIYFQCDQLVEVSDRWVEHYSEWTVVLSK